MRHALPLLLKIALLVSGTASAQDNADSALVKRGEYLVTVGGCHDCHTPWTMGSSGPEPDMTRALSGHPQDIAIKVAPTVPAPWGGAVSQTNTAWSGPWGVSFTANLTPDPETGVLRDFTEQQFIQTMRTGRHQGQGRQILPPMPWPNYGRMTDEDLKAVFVYLRQVPPVKNKVPDPIPPTQ
ncbi:c-type cytochrome [Microvirga roseola]|uniref:c-type cytochrome n=1 Tax=Microvirga roseola TaxID=2883126 RepID=UPI001E52F108|nr:diheme cytochrome c-553 [Microvirga roseola]